MFFGPLLKSIACLTHALARQRALFSILSRLAPCSVAPACPATTRISQNPGDEGNGNVTIGPEYKIDPDLTDRGNPKGKSFEFSMPLADSKIFRGDDPTLEPEKKPVRKERKIFVYVPAAYKDGTKAPDPHHSRRPRASSTWSATRSIT